MGNCDGSIQFFETCGFFQKRTPWLLAALVSESAGAQNKWIMISCMIVYPIPDRAMSMASPKPRVTDDERQCYPGVSAALLCTRVKKTMIGVLVCAFR